MNIARLVILFSCLHDSSCANLSSGSSHDTVLPLDMFGIISLMIGSQSIFAKNKYFPIYSILFLDLIFILKKSLRSKQLMK